MVSLLTFVLCESFLNLGFCLVLSVLISLLFDLSTLADVVYIDCGGRLVYKRGERDHLS